MTIDAVAFIPPISMPSIGEAGDAAAAPSGEFTTWFTQQLSEANNQLAVADKGMQQLAAGDATNLHQVMINLEQAKLSMQLVMQVRNHLLDAYHELLQMQV